MAPLVVGLLTGLNEVERELCRERTRESIAHRRRSVDNLGGRPTLSKVKTKLIDCSLEKRVELNQENFTANRS